MGNLAVRREWGFAPDYVDGMIRICRQIAVRADVTGAPVEPDMGSNYRDYVLGTGQQNAVWELIDRAFELGGCPLEWDRIVGGSGRVDGEARRDRRAGRGRRPVVHPARGSGDDRNGSVAGARNELAWRPTAGPRLPSSPDMLAVDPDAPSGGWGTADLIDRPTRYPGAGDACVHVASSSGRLRAR